MDVGSSPSRMAANSWITAVRPGPRKASPNPVIFSSVSIFTMVQSKFDSTTAVLRCVIFISFQDKLPGEARRNQIQRLYSRAS